MDRAPLPELYDAWLADFLPGGIPQEERATCSDCVMCVKEDGVAPSSAYFFNPDVKCCVFTPRLPNFIVGNILSDTSEDNAAGVRTVRERIASGVAVTPMGLIRSPSYDVRYQSSANAFGNSEALLCPHYDQGKCGIWRHRTATCATWFCQFVRGRAGQAFWIALKKVLVTVEREVAVWCALELGIGLEHLQQELPAAPGELPPGSGPYDWQDMDGEVVPARQAVLWGEWAGREEAFYQRAAELVRELSWSDVLNLSGVEVQVRARLARQAWERLVSPATPVRLQANAFEVTGTRPGGVRATTFSMFDAIDLPGNLVAILPHFNGRPVGQILEELRGYGVELEPAFLQQLVDWEILVPAGPRQLPVVPPR